MLKKIFFPFLIIFAFSQIIAAQVYLNSVKIDEETNSDTTHYCFKKIEIFGNRKTKPNIILRELLFSQDEFVQLSQIIAAQKRVRSLALFTRVRFDITGDTEHYTLNITVNEQWYIFIYPTLYMNEKSWNKISYGASLRYYNFLGRNIYLKIKAVHGYNPMYKFIYHNPWFLGNNKLYTKLILFKRKVRSKSPAHNKLDDSRIGFDWVIGKRFGHFTFTGIDFKYIEISASPETGLTVSSSGKDRLLSMSGSFGYDNRDLKEYPHKGWWLKLHGKVAGKSGWLPYYQYGVEIRRYVPIKQNVTLAVRSATILSKGKIPIYDRTYFGYNERIRGRFYDIFEGENLILGSAEIRFPIKKIEYFNLPLIPGLENYTSQLKFGISAGIFYDTGITWFQNQKLAVKSFNSGFGFGLHFHLPYVDVLRVEGGFNHQQDVQVIVDVGTAF
ncbi:BamA/TamA family outer membrane protein [candidate division KSB1 bacterium]|nr:BamA/TamA family outer membrane protein [candidate division KSB1 bacterium]